MDSAKVWESAKLTMRILERNYFCEKRCQIFQILQIKMPQKRTIAPYNPLSSLRVPGLGPTSQQRRHQHMNQVLITRRTVQDEA
jgi:hypothetical protein